MRRQAASLVLLVGALAVGAALPFVLSTYNTGVLGLAWAYAIAAMAQTMLTGTANQPSLGNSAFLGISAFATGALTTDAHWPLLAAAATAVALAGIVGFAAGLPAVRISGLYLAIVSIALVFVMQEFLTQYNQILGRASVGVVRPDWLASDRALYAVSFVLAVIVGVLLWNLLRSRIGRAFVAIRDSEAAAEAVGIRLSTYKTLAFALSGAVTGVAGVLIAEYYQGVTPATYGIALSLQLVAMAVVGGLGSLPGAIVGAFIITLLDPLLGGLPATVGPFNVHGSAPLLSALLLVITLAYSPRGLWPQICRGYEQMVERRARPQPETVS